MDFLFYLAHSLDSYTNYNNILSILQCHWIFIESVSHCESSARNLWHLWSFYIKLRAPKIKYSFQNGTFQVFLACGSCIRFIKCIFYDLNQSGEFAIAS